MNWKKLIKNVNTGVMLLIMGITPFFTSCATILGGGGKPAHLRDTSRIRWGYVIADVLFTGAIGLIIDFANGAIYESKDISNRSDIEKNIMNALNHNMPAYIVKKDGYYKANMKDGKLEYQKVGDEEIPQSVKNSINNFITKTSSQRNIN